MVIAVKTYVNRLNINIVGPRAASSNVPVNCSPGTGIKLENLGPIRAVKVT